MSRSPIGARHLAALVLVALAAGAIAARADSGGAGRPPRIVARPVAVPAVPRTYAAPVFAVAPQKFAGPPTFLRLDCKSPTEPSSPGAAPTKALLDAFAVLRRERRPEDALPADALEALKRSNLAPVDPTSARLLRTTPSGGRAWVVPVPDVTRSLPFPCRPRTTPGAREGLAVVALGDAAPGGGGALGDLIRGRAPVWVDACSGQNRDLLGISGIVPDGVSAAFLTAPDGTAVRADVEDNAYEFLVPRPHVLEQRYVVWSGGDGTPHVQPVVAQGVLLRGAVCDRLAKLRPVPKVTPVGYLGACAERQVLPVPIVPRARRDRVRPGRVPAPILAVGCALARTIPLPPRAPRPVPAPKPR